jgi:hypothetical protein
LVLARARWIARPLCPHHPVALGRPKQAACRTTRRNPVAYRLFEDRRAFEEFTKGNFEFGADVNAAVITAAAGGSLGTAGASAAQWAPRCLAAAAAGDSAGAHGAARHVWRANSTGSVSARYEAGPSWIFCSTFRGKRRRYFVRILV